MFKIRAFKKRQGFSLVELMVAVLIITLVTSIVLVGQSGFGGSILLTNLAYDMALSIREAQNYGLSVKESKLGGSGFDIGYGIHFVKAASPTDQKSYILFADRGIGVSKNNRFDSGEEVKTYQLYRSNFISQFCVKSASGLLSCSDDPSIGSVDLVFNRAESEATIMSDIGGPYASATITIASPDGQTRVIEVTLAGQISVSNPNL